LNPCQSPWFLLELPPHLVCFRPSYLRAVHLNVPPLPAPHPGELLVEVLQLHLVGLPFHPEFFEALFGDLIERCLHLVHRRAQF